jgi:hypothetical protein
MTESSRSLKTVQAWLELTQAEELDCDRFAELLAPWVDQRIDDQRLLAIFEHHRRLCAECAEEAELLLRAAGKTAP